MNNTVSFEDIKNSSEIRTYIARADETLSALGYSEHSFTHVTKCSSVAYDLLTALEFEPRTCELARIAGFMHDIGNVINRSDHAHSGAILAFRLLEKMGMQPEEIATVVQAIGNHDEKTAVVVNAVGAAVILADKSDVRRSRVRNRDATKFDIHDRVNYAVECSVLKLELEKQSVTLQLSVNSEICPAMEYFEIFTQRMLLCRRAANFLGLTFHLRMNDVTLL
ncbi:MAG: HD domain-containing protein [Oscillospiraceae bacterium]